MPSSAMQDGHKNVYKRALFSFIKKYTRRPVSADSTARRQFQCEFQYLFISRVYLFYDIQWNRIRGIPFIVKSHNNTHNKSKCIF